MLSGVPVLPLGYGGNAPERKPMSDTNNPIDWDAVIADDAVEKVMALPEAQRAEIMAILDKLN